MSRAVSIYPVKKNLERELRKIETDPFNKEILTSYYKVRSTQVEPTTIVADFGRINVMSRILNKKFEDATLQDMQDLNFKIGRMPNKDNTKNKFRKVLKAFYGWLRGYPKGDFPPEVKWITLKRIPSVTVRSEDLLSYEECIRITEQAATLRDKALFQCLLDSGCRIGEVLTVKVGEVEFNERGAILYADGKTGPQPCILTWSAEILRIWMDNHPFKHDKEAPLWPVMPREKPLQMSYASAKKSFKKCVKKAGYPDRRVWLHLLKHVSSTHDANTGMPDSFRRYKHHWTQNSKMPAVYEHLSQSIIPNIQNETWKKVIDSAVVKKWNDTPHQGSVMSGIDRLLAELKGDPKKVEKLLALIS